MGTNLAKQFQGQPDDEVWGDAPAGNGNGNGHPRTDGEGNIEALAKAMTGKGIRVVEDPRMRKATTTPNNARSPLKPKATTVPTSDPTPPPPPAPPKSPSIMEKFRAVASAMATTEAVMAKLEEADAFGATPELVLAFTIAVVRGDEIGVRRFSLDLIAAEARQAWFSLTDDQRIAKLSEWAKTGDTAAKEVADVALALDEHPMVRDMYWRVVTQIARPCAGLATLQQLVDFLAPFARTKAVTLTINPRTIPDHGVVVKKENGDTVLYEKAKDASRIIHLGWQFIKEAADRINAKEAARQARIAAGRAKEEAEQKERNHRDALDLESWDAQITPGLGPTAVTDGKEGVFPLSLDKGHVLIRAQKQGDVMFCRVIEAVGVNVVGPLPGQWVRWDPDNCFEPLRGHKWPAKEISQALLDLWRDEIAQKSRPASRAESQRTEEPLDPAISLATPNFPLGFAGQAFTRLLKGEPGIVAGFNNNFRWDNITALLAFALERREDGQMILRAVVGKHHNFPAELVGKALPPFTMCQDSDGTPRMELHNLPDDRQIERGLAMLQMAINLRLKAESKALGEKPAPAGQ